VDPSGDVDGCDCDRAIGVDCARFTPEREGRHLLFFTPGGSESAHRERTSGKGGKFLTI
jgi:hypothetical protein